MAGLRYLLLVAFELGGMAAIAGGLWLVWEPLGIIASGLAALAIAQAMEVKT